MTTRAGDRWADTFVDDLHAGTQMDYVMANPPFNVRDWARDERDPRWRFGVPRPQRQLRVDPAHPGQAGPGGKAGVVMANGSMSSNAAGEGEIRARIVDADLVSCMVALPAQLFRSTSIPVCLWFFAMAKGDRSGQVLFVDARDLGQLVDRAERALGDDDVARIGDTYHAWSGSRSAAAKGLVYEDVPGFCRSVSLDEIRSSEYALTPGRYVGAPATEADGEPPRPGSRGSPATC